MLNPITDIARFTCACGKWLLVFKTATKEEPCICPAPCHSGKTCGRQYYWEGEKVLMKEELAHE